MLNLIVDGQQRLTTIWLIINRGALPKLPSPRLLRRPDCGKVENLPVMNFPRQCLHPAQAQFIFAAETKSTEFNAMMAIEEVFESPAVKSVEIEILDVMSEVIGKWRDPQCEIAVLHLLTVRKNILNKMFVLTDE